jgi:hypothetical protein
MKRSGHHHVYYPGYRHGVRFVSQGCLGAAPRPLVGTVARPPRSFTVIDFDADGAIRIDALAGADFTVPIARQALPERIESPWVTLVRDDLAPRAAKAPPR